MFLTVEWVVREGGRLLLALLKYYALIKYEITVFSFLVPRLSRPLGPSPFGRAGKRDGTLLKRRPNFYTIL
tara:strand:- start:251 stop:463 length:213 start_codon:yes stop_codon:yes gene_type:complete